MKTRPAQYVLIAIILGLASLIWTGDTEAQTQPVTIDAYWAQVEETQSVIAGLMQADVQTVRAHLDSEADRWATVTRVQLHDGTVIPIDHSYLVAQLRATPPDLEAIEELLGTLRTYQDSWPQPPSVTTGEGGDPFEQLNAILAQPEFQWESAQQQSGGALQQWLASLQRRIWELFRDLLPRRGGIGSRVPTVVLSVIGVVLLAVILAYALRGLLSGFVAESELEGEAEEAEEGLTSRVALERAQIEADSHDYRTAARYLYLSSLLLLEERGLLRYDRSRTNREYLHSLAQQPKLAAIFDQVIEVFDRVWYGHQTLDEASYAQYATHIAELRRQK
jgi:hypothetical protein